VNTTAAKPVPANAANSTWTQGRTPDGQPDLQGTWTNASNIPLERPKNLGAKEFYVSAEEAAAAKASAGRADAVVVPEAHYDLSQFGLDQRQGKFAASLRTSLIVGPDGKIPPMLPAAQKRNADRVAKVKGHEFDSAQNRPLGERCIIWPQEGPPMMPLGYNNNMEFVQAPGYVAILNEMIHDVRIIPLDGPLNGRPHVDAKVRQWRGDSRGHWEGNTLVVETTNFTDKTSIGGNGVAYNGEGGRNTEALRVVERFTRTAPDTLEYRATIDDPGTWTRPWTIQIPFLRDPNYGFFEYACHEGNYAMKDILSGARAEEQKAGAARK